MRVPFPKLSLFAGIVVLCAGTASAQWDASPAIEGAAVKRSKAMYWVNIAETVDLRSKGSDGDTYTCSDTTEYDYIDLAATTWSCDQGQYVLGSPGVEVAFAPTVASSTEIVVTATIQDQAAPADDEDVQKTVAFKAYKVGAHMSFNGAGIGTPPAAQDVWQQGGTQASASQAVNLGWTGTSYQASGASNPVVTKLKQVTVQWTTTVFPGSAALGSGGLINVPIGVAEDETCDIEAKAIRFGSGGADSVSVGLSGGAGISAGVSFTWSLTSVDYALAAIGAALSSDDLGDGDTCKLEIRAGDPGANTWNRRAPNYANTATFVGGIGAISKAKYIVSGEAKAADDDYQDAWIGSTVGTIWKITGRPSYTAGSGANPDPGY